MLVAAGLGYVQSKIKMNWLVLRSMLYCSLIPDLDVLGFKFGIPYESMWGHRGFSHSIFFAILLGLFVALVLNVKLRMSCSKVLSLWFLMSASALSHLLLDALTNGGHGIALLAPFSNIRYFLPWRPIEVSPIGGAFFSAQAIPVLQSEALYLGGPVLGAVLFVWFYRRFVRNKDLSI